MIVTYNLSLAFYAHRIEREQPRYGERYLRVARSSTCLLSFLDWHADLVLLSYESLSYERRSGRRRGALPGAQELCGSRCGGGRGYGLGYVIWVFRIRDGDAGQGLVLC